MNPATPRHKRRRVWLLDLDNTLHDALAHVFPRINVAMTRYIERELNVLTPEAERLRTLYWQRYGATLLGLVRHHGIDADHFLHETHGMDDLHSVVRRDHRLVHLLQRLPGHRVLVTNAPRAYATVVVRALGIHRLLDDIVTIESMQFNGRLQPKPSRPMFRRLVARQRVHVSQCVLVEDSIENLRQAKAVGMQGVLVTGFGHRGDERRARVRAIGARRFARQLSSVTQLRRLALD